MILRYKDIDKNWKKEVNEKLGINYDGEILSDFIIGFLSKAEPNKVYVFQKEDVPLPDNYDKNPNIIFIHQLPKLEKNIYKVIINYTDKVHMGEAFFDPANSKYTKNGFILKFTFLHREERGKIWKHVIYHEILHAVQFLKMGKNKMTFNKKYIKVNIAKNIFKLPPFSTFLQYLYLSIKIEQGAFIAQFYGKIKNRKKIKNESDLRKYFINRDIYEFKVIDTLKNVNLKKIFDSTYLLPDGQKIKATDQEIKTFFSYLKHLGKRINEFDNLENFMKNSIKIMKISENDIITDDVEINGILRRYENYFHKIGNDLERKIDKTYTLLLDYFENKSKKDIKK